LILALGIRRESILSKHLDKIDVYRQGLIWDPGQTKRETGTEYSFLFFMQSRLGRGGALDL
jgi:hypothetical protein